MKIRPGMEVLISQANSCHNGEVGLVDRLVTLGAMVRVRDCVHLVGLKNMRPVPEQDTIPEPES